MSCCMESIKLSSIGLHCSWRTSQRVLYVSVDVDEATDHSLVGELRLVSCMIDCFFYTAEFIIKTVGNLEASSC
jgi:hypothetical protein